MHLRCNEVSRIEFLPAHLTHFVWPSMPMCITSKSPVSLHEIDRLPDVLRSRACPPRRWSLDESVVFVQPRGVPAVRPALAAWVGARHATNLAALQQRHVLGRREVDDDGAAPGHEMIEQDEPSNALAGRGPILLSAAVMASSGQMLLACQGKNELQHRNGAEAGSSWSRCRARHRRQTPTVAGPTDRLKHSISAAAGVSAANIMV